MKVKFPLNIIIILGCVCLPIARSNAWWISEKKACEYVESCVKSSIGWQVKRIEDFTNRSTRTVIENIACSNFTSDSNAKTASISVSFNVKKEPEAPMVFFAMGAQDPIGFHNETATIIPYDQGLKVTFIANSLRMLEGCMVPYKHTVNKKNVHKKTVHKKTITIHNLQGNPIVTKDFIHNGITRPDTSNVGNYFLADTAKDFNIVYFGTGESFGVGLGSGKTSAIRLGQLRIKAEKTLQNILGISKYDMCRLNYYVGTSVYENDCYAGKNLGFSFCPGATQLTRKTENVCKEKDKQARDLIMKRTSEKLPHFREGTSYLVVRKNLMKLGWRPVTLPSATPCGHDERCKGFSEVYFCSGVGRAVCNYTWKKNATLIWVSAGGEGWPQSFLDLIPCEKECK